MERTHPTDDEASALHWSRRLVCCGYYAAAFSVDRWSADTNSPSFETFEVGGDVTCIIYHPPQGEGDAHYCDVHYQDGRATRHFRPSSVRFTP